MTWESLVEQVKPAIRGYIRRTQHVHGSAEDAEQEAMLLCWQAYSTYAGESTDEHLRARVLVTLSNRSKRALRDYYRGDGKHRGELTVSRYGESWGPDPYDTVQAEGPAIDEDLYRREALHHAAEMVGGLGKRIVNELLYGQDCYRAAVKQASARTEKPGTVRVTARALSEALGVSHTTVGKALETLEVACRAVAQA